MTTMTETLRGTSNVAISTLLQHEVHFQYALVNFLWYNKATRSDSFRNHKHVLRSKCTHPTSVNTLRLLKDSPFLFEWRNSPKIKHASSTRVASVVSLVVGR